MRQVHLWTGFRSSWRCWRRYIGRRRLRCSGFRQIGQLAVTGSAPQGLVDSPCVRKAETRQVADTSDSAHALSARGQGLDLPAAGLVQEGDQCLASPAIGFLRSRLRIRQDNGGSTTDPSSNYIDNYEFKWHCSSSVFLRRQCHFDLRCGANSVRNTQPFLRLLPRRIWRGCVPYWCAILFAKAVNEVVEVTEINAIMYPANIAP